MYKILLFITTVFSFFLISQNVTYAQSSEWTTTPDMLFPKDDSDIYKFRGHKVANNNHYYQTFFIEGTPGETVDVRPNEDEDLKTLTGYKEAFITSYDGNGSYVFTQSIGYADNSSSNLIVEAAEIETSEQYIYIAGMFNGTVTFGNNGNTEIAINSGTHYTLFIVLMDMQGNFVDLYTATAAGSYADVAYGGFAIDPDTGDIYIGGSFQGTIDFDLKGGTNSLTSEGSLDAYLAKYDDELNLEYVFRWGNNNITTTSFSGLDIAQDHVYYAVGPNTPGSIVDFDIDPSVEENIVQVHEHDSVLIKMQKNGDLVWSFLFSSASLAGTDSPFIDDEYIDGLHLDSEEFIYINLRSDSDKVLIDGEEYDLVDDPDSNNNTNNEMEFLTIKLNKQGEVQWVKQFHRMTENVTLWSRGPLYDENNDILIIAGLCEGDGFIVDGETYENPNDQSALFLAMQNPTDGNIEKVLFFDMTGGEPYLQDLSRPQIQDRDGTSYLFMDFISGLLSGSLTMDADLREDYTLNYTVYPLSPPNIDNNFFSLKLIPPYFPEIASSKKFTKDTRCHSEKPPETTWIKLEQKEKDGDGGVVGEYGKEGTLVTWTQYSADRVDIKIDDGTGNYPWMIEGTLNDGIEFLPNVQPWQKIKIKPINHCREGDYSPSVSQKEFPSGWYNN